MTIGQGTVIAGRYHLQSVLGEGGGGVVWRATQPELGREVAVKMLRSSHAGPRERARFEREARVAGALDHPSAVAVHDFGEHEGQLFLVMELVQGRSLRECIDPPLSFERIIEIGREISEVLMAAHRLTLVHRDLKPENVLLEASGRVRVLDFGLAFVVESERDARMTREGVIAGTPAYLSPEQAQGAHVGPPTDVYALGCILFEMVAGQPPFGGADLQVLTKQLYAPAPNLRRAGEPVPAALDALVATMLDKRAPERPSAGAVRDALAGMDPHGRGRARGEAPLAGRAARMVAPVTAEPSLAARETNGEVAVVGAVAAELLLALSARGLGAFVVTEDQPLERPDVIFAPGATPERVHALSDVAPVVTDGDPSDVTRLREMIRAGAAEVVPLPIEASELVRRLRRTLRRGRP